MITAAVANALLVALGCSGADCPHGTVCLPGEDMAQHNAHFNYHARETLAARKATAP